MVNKLLTLKPGYFERLHFRLSNLGRLPMWTIYVPMTPEYPGFWVARMHVAIPSPRPSRFVITHESLQGLRDALPQGLVKIRRTPADHPSIVETWI